MKNQKEAIRELQKTGVFSFEGLTREESKAAAIKLAKATMQADKEIGVVSSFGIARDAFGFYSARQINA